MARRKKLKRLQSTSTAAQNAVHRQIEQDFGLVAPIIGPLGFTPELTRIDPVTQTANIIYRVPYACAAPNPASLKADPPFSCEGAEPLLIWLAKCTSPHTSSDKADDT